MNELRTYTLAIFLLMGLLCTSIIVFTWGHVKQKKQHQEEKRALQIKYEQILLQSQEIREQTLKAIAGELHDNLGHIASLIKIRLELLPLTTDRASSGKIQEAKDLICQLLFDLKSMALSLNGTLISTESLDKRIQEELRQLERLGVFNVRFAPPETMPPLSYEKSMTLFRMVQEVLTNSLNHSKAKNISVVFNYNANKLALIISDDGVGFDVMRVKRDNCLGIAGLKDRAKLINADLTITSAIGSGTKVTIETSIA